MTIRSKISFSLLALTLVFVGSKLLWSQANEKEHFYNKTLGKEIKMEKIHKSDEEWKKQLTEEQYYITRQKGTERPFTGKYNKHMEKGIYQCVACGLDLFSSETKFNSKTGWPSYGAPISEKNITTQVDHSLFITRTEVLCARCDAHLGHLFEDGPKPTTLRYCINSAALNFKKVD